MASDNINKEDKFDFTTEGESLGYIGLDQARVLAIRHARDNPGFYIELLGSSYSGVNFVWELVSQEESEEYFEIKLYFRPVGRFRGEPGLEHFTIDKLGNIEVRQILDEPTGLGETLGSAAIPNDPKPRRAPATSSPASKEPPIEVIQILGKPPTNRSGIVTLPSDSNLSNTDALANYDKAIGLSPNDADLWNNRGNTLNDLGRIEEALTSFDQGIDLNPDHAHLWSNRGDVLAELNRPLEALGCYERAIYLSVGNQQKWDTFGKERSGGCG